MCVVETVHVRRMKGERREKDEGGEGKTNLFGTKNERRVKRREGREERTNSCSG